MTLSSEYRVFIDESGDHTYKNFANPATRYLGLTATVVRKATYAGIVPPRLESLKQDHFRYDPDDPPILTRSNIVKRRRWFGVLKQRSRSVKWENDLEQFYLAAPGQYFSVVIDKHSHYNRFFTASFNPYAYSLAVLLNRIRGYLNINNATADILAESRGRTEDAQLQLAFEEMRASGSGECSGADYCAVYPADKIIFKRKDQNIAGLQVVDLLAYGLKWDIVERRGLTVPSKGLTSFTRRLNSAVQGRINQYGRYFLD